MSGEEKREKTWLIVKDGKYVKDHKIEVRTLTKILNNVQKAYDNIGHSKYGRDYKKEDFQLYIGEIQKGSVALPLSPQTFAPRLFDEFTSFKSVTISFENLVDALGRNHDTFKETIEEEVNDLSDRIGVIKSLEALSQNESPVHLKSSVEKPTEEGHGINKNDSSILKELRIKYTTPGELTIYGVMIAFNAEKDFFTIKTENGRNVRCYFDKKDAEYYHSFFWKWVKVIGTAATTERGYKLISVDEISEHKTETVEKIGDYKFKKPIEFITSYETDDKIWGLVNEELALYGYGTNYLKAIRSLEENIEGLVITFTRHPDNQHTKESLLVKKNLQTYIDFREVNKKIHEKYGDN